jgi:hypothetical protein
MIPDRNNETAILPAWVHLITVISWNKAHSLLGYEDRMESLSLFELMFSPSEVFHADLLTLPEQYLAKHRAPLPTGAPQIWGLAVKNLGFPKTCAPRKHLR